MNPKWRNWLDNILKKVLEGAPLTNVNVYCTIEFVLMESNFVVKRGVGLYAR